MKSTSCTISKTWKLKIFILPTFFGFVLEFVLNISDSQKRIFVQSLRLFLKNCFVICENTPLFFYVFLVQMRVCDRVLKRSIA